MNDSNFMLCDNSNSSILRKWSGFCLDNSNGFPDQCFSSDHKLTFWLGLWCIINAVIGFAGNLLTILAIPYAANRKKYARHLQSLLRGCPIIIWTGLNSKIGIVQKVYEWPSWYFAKMARDSLITRIVSELCLFW